MKKFLLILLLSPVLLFGQKPGQIISYEKNLDLTPEGVVRRITQDTESANQFLVDIASQYNYGMIGYKLKYYTTDYDGRIVEAAGEVLFPKTNKKLSLLIDCHATLLNRKSNPSDLGGKLPVQFTIGPFLFAAAEYVVIAPDYIGYGNSEERARFTHEETTVNAIVDMYDAAKVMLDEINLETYDETFLTGYSLGAHAAIGTQKRLSGKAGYDFKYTTVGGGPYDLEVATMEKGVLKKEVFLISAFLAFVMDSADGVGYNLYDGDFRNVIKEKYHDAYLKNVKQKTLNILWGPIQWRNLFDESFIKAIETDMNHPLRQYLRDNSVYDWYNQYPTHYMHGAWDVIITPSNMTTAVNAQRGYYPWYDWDKYQIKKTDVGPFTHLTGLLPYTIMVLHDFNSRRAGGYFNLRADYRAADYVDNQFTVRRSSIRPEFYLGNKKLPSTLHMLETRGEDYTQGAFVAHTKVDNKVLKFPVAIEEAIKLSNKKAFRKDDNQIYFNMPNVEYVNVWRNNQLVMSEKAQAISTQSLKKNDVIEMVTDKSIFTTKYMAQSYSAFTNGNQVIVSGDTNIQAISAYDTSGRMLYQKEGLNGKEHQFDTSAQGLIVLSIVDEDGQTHGLKVVK